MTFLWGFSPRYVIYASIRKLGILYLNGEGVVQNYNKAIELLKKLDDAYSQSIIGFMYSKGLGVEQDNEQAVCWFELAASQGDTYSQVNLGMLYANGLGVEQNYEKAKHWCEKAAKRNDVGVLRI